MKKYDVFKNPDNTYQIRNSSHASVVEFDDDENERIFLYIMDFINNNEILDFAKLHHVLLENNEYEKDKINEVYQHLDNINLFDYLKKETDSNIELSLKTITIIGDSELSLILQRDLLKLNKFKTIERRTFVEIENIDESFWQNNDFIIVDGSIWSPFHIGEINKKALQYDTPWLFTQGIEESTIKIGPLFFGKETGCYECLIARIKSMHDYPDYFEIYENHLKTNKSIAKPSTEQRSEYADNILSNWIIMELSRFFDDKRFCITWRNMICFDLFKYVISHNYLLKKPYCETCKPELAYNISPWLEPVTLK
ncbi:hypothetical protein M2451_003811 [Dysgonomonas sp. PFB1-18]|uniref:hypothetical protein n=1 Tax=unclassified Dysgonomonas TaxID=2630389 RepID=UPI0024741420|nr:MULTISPECIES: hypothetical protein [unclassified Dysgonomonas]MDH6310947.1 hypothetical protein [Dysgonomonas sp. PF1-14]MDH6340838.1 hypothetical protein [Dysgonomonas sp. PF1-16]MDH6382470.1 hypothetical protein [Dysgonomonas sp. PFB1-18]MDH6399819.1 hypothetical protein [Dysgonomonas sp. PF1-23]